MAGAGRLRGLVDHAAGGRAGLDVRQQVEDVLVGGGLRHWLQAVGLVPQLDHTPAEKRSEPGCSPNLGVFIPSIITLLCNAYKELQDVPGRIFNPFRKKSIQPFFY